MGTFHRFEDIQAWQNAREISRRSYQLTAAGEFARDFGFMFVVESANQSFFFECDLPVPVLQGYGFTVLFKTLVHFAKKCVFF